MAAIHDALVAAGMVAGLAATVITAKHGRYTGAFQKAGAVSAANAKELHELGLRDSWIRRRLTAKGVLVVAGRSKYYLVEDVLAARRARGRRIGLAVVLVLAVALVAIFALT